MSDPNALLGLCNTYLRPPVTMAADAQGTVTTVFSPPLTTAEQAVYADLVLMARFGVTMTLAEWQAVKPDAQLLRAFLGIASPTNAQAVAAVKSIIRVLGVIVRS